MEMMGRFARRFRHEEDGMIMFIVITVMLIATVIGIAAFTLAQQSLHEAVRIQEESEAFHAADAGMEAALSNINHNGFNVGDYPMEKTLENGASYSVVVEDLGNSEYKATSVGRSADGGEETLVNRFFFLNIWEMNIAAGSQQSLAAGSGGMMGTSFFYGPLYVRGTLPMGNVDILGGPLFVKDGDIVKAQGSPQIGEPSEPVDIYVSGAIGSGVTVYAGNISQSVPDITIPLIQNADLQMFWNKAKNESYDNILGTPATSSTNNQETDDGTPARYTVMSLPIPVKYDGVTTEPRRAAPGATVYYKVIGDASGIQSTSGSPYLTLTIGGDGTGADSFGAWDGCGYPLGSGLHDDFAYDDTTKTLYIEGTVFVDGDVIFDGDIQYVGNGTIVAMGDVYINDTLRAKTLSGHVDAGHAIGIVTPGDIIFGGSGGNPRPPADMPDFSGAFFCNGVAQFTANTYLKGSIVAGNMRFDHPNSHLVTDPNLPSFLPDSLPGNGAFFLARGQWTRQ